MQSSDSQQLHVLIALAGLGGLSVSPSSLEDSPAMQLAFAQQMWHIFNDYSGHS